MPGDGATVVKKSPFVPFVSFDPKFVPKSIGTIRKPFVGEQWPWTRMIKTYDGRDKLLKFFTEVCKWFNCPKGVNLIGDARGIFGLLNSGSTAIFDFFDAIIKSVAFAVGIYKGGLKEKDKFSDGHILLARELRANDKIKDQTKSHQCSTCKSDLEAKPLDPDKLNTVESKYPTPIAKILGFVTELARVSEKACFLMCFAVCNPLRVAARNSITYVSEEMKALGNKFDVFWMGFHLSAIVINTCEIIRLHIVEIEGTMRVSPAEHARAIRSAAMRLFENAADFVGDLCKVFQIYIPIPIRVAFSSSSAIVGTFRIFQETTRIEG